MISLTSSAVHHIRQLILARDVKPIGIRIGVNTKGCSGLSYALEFVDKVLEGDEVLNIENIKIFLDPKVTLFVLGMQVDYVEGELESGFKFLNPNEKGRCGCGESFHI